MKIILSVGDAAVIVEAPEMTTLSNISDVLEHSTRKVIEIHNKANNADPFIGEEYKDQMFISKQELTGLIGGLNDVLDKLQPRSKTHMAVDAIRSRLVDIFND